MRRILISEPHPTVRRMLERMVSSLGHEPVVVSDDPPTPARLRSADVLLIEPADPAGSSLARTARAANPAVAIVYAGIAAPAAELTRLSPNLAASLAKPFTIEQLDAALQQAIAHRDSLSSTP
jgi:CheY-like chemotaxis protein